MKTFLIVMLFLCAMQTDNISLVLAKNESLNSSEDIELELENTIDDLLQDFDLEQMDTFYVDEYSVFDNTSFREKVTAILHGEYFEDYDSL